MAKTQEELKELKAMSKENTKTLNERELTDEVLAQVSGAKEQMSNGVPSDESSNAKGVIDNTGFFDMSK